MRNRPSGLAISAGLAPAAGGGLAAAVGGGLLLCTSVLRVQALVRGKAADWAGDGADGSIEAVTGDGGGGGGAGWLPVGVAEPPNQPAKGFQPLADFVGAAGAEPPASGLQLCSAEAVRVDARAPLATDAGASGSPLSAKPAS